MKTRKKSEGCAAGKNNFPIWNLTLQHCLIMNSVPRAEVSNIAFFHLSVLLKNLSSLQIPASKSGTRQDLELPNTEPVFSAGFLKLQNRFRAEKLYGFF